jgi:hypothetical protein
LEFKLGRNRFLPAIVAAGNFNGSFQCARVADPCGFGFCKGGSFVFSFHWTDGTFPLSEKIIAATQSSHNGIENVPPVSRFTVCRPVQGKIKIPTYESDTWGTLYDGVGSVKRHLGFTSREGSFFSSPIRIFSLSSSFISTKARFVNLVVNLVPPTIYSVSP